MPQLALRLKLWGHRLREAWQRYHSLDRRGERAADRHLRRLGYKIVARRLRGKMGELDLVAVDHQTIVFVEVKTRRSHRTGRPEDAVDPMKQQRLTRLALTYLKRHDLLDYRARFDVVAVTWPAASRRPTLRHFPNAFEAVGKGQMFR